MRSKGFTLIEILLAMAVILIISGGSYVAFTKFNQSQTLNSTYENLRNTLNEAKSSALSQVIFKCNDLETLVGYQVKFNTLSIPNTYSLQEVCQGVSGKATNEVKKTSLPTDVTVTSSSSPILFLVLSGKIQDSGTVTVILSNGNQKTITITNTGVIQ